jgi:hypothetical protein
VATAAISRQIVWTPSAITAITADRSRETLTAINLLDMIEKDLIGIHKFFKFDRTDIIKGIEETSDALKSNLSPKRKPPMKEPLLYTLLILFLTSLYYATYDNLDIIKKL